MRRRQRGLSSGFGPPGGSYSNQQSSSGPPSYSNSIPSREKTVFDVRLLIISGIIGAVAFFICKPLYSKYLYETSRILIIGIVFGILALCVFVSVNLYCSLSGIIRRNILARNAPPLNPWMMMCCFVIVIMVLSALFQFLYSLNTNQTSAEPTSYVFLIDNSSSMDDNDKDGMRYRAIKQILGKKDSDFEYMVYGFSNDCKEICPMTKVAEGVSSISAQNQGCTNLRLAMETVISDHKNQSWSGGLRPMVVLLTDGYATDLFGFRDLKRTIHQYNRQGLAVSAIGLGDADNELLDRIAQSTGGVFIDVAKASELVTAMNYVATNRADRDLVSYRFTPQLNWLYAILRIVFLWILGSAFGLFVAILFGVSSSTELIVVSSLIKSLVGALIMEIGTVQFGFSASWMWFWLWMFIATIFAERPSGGRAYGRSNRGSSYKHGSNRIIS